MKIEVSDGEIVDKLTILEIKLVEIKDEAKLVNVTKEYTILNDIVQELFKYYQHLHPLYLKLVAINSTLWDVEDRLRELEKEKRFDKEFIELARSVYKTNDHRSEIKKQINILTNSILIEEKSYK